MNSLQLRPRLPGKIFETVYFEAQPTWGHLENPNELFRGAQFVVDLRWISKTPKRNPDVSTRPEKQAYIYIDRCACECMWPVRDKTFLVRNNNNSSIEKGNPTTKLPVLVTLVNLLACSIMLEGTVMGVVDVGKDKWRQIWVFDLTIVREKARRRKKIDGRQIKTRIVDIFLFHQSHGLYCRHHTYIEGRPFNVPIEEIHEIIAYLISSFYKFMTWRRTHLISPIISSTCFAQFLFLLQYCIINRSNTSRRILQTVTWVSDLLLQRIKKMK